MDHDRSRAPDEPGAPHPVSPITGPGDWTPPAGSPGRPSAGWTPPAPGGWDPPPKGRGRRALATTAVVLAVVFVFALGLTIGQAGTLLPGPGAAPSYSPSIGRPSWELLDEAFDVLERHYVDQEALDPLELERGAIRGMTESLDDRGHTGYLTPDEINERDEGLSGTFVGVGAVLDQREDGSVYIVRVLRDSPAERAGVLAGDEIVTVDGEPLTGLSLDDVVSRVRGPEGSDVRLELRGTGGATRTQVITRARLDLPLVSWGFAPGSRDAVIRLESFSAGAGGAFEQALRQALDAGAEGLVLDLRGNPGGYVNEPVAVASQLLDDEVVYLSVDRSGKETAHRTEGTPLAPDLPLVVLVDGQTASSAEIVTGALQDADRAWVVGETTFGTGTVVSTYPLADGGALTVGTERWLTPSGRAIWREGVAPDQVVELPTGATLVTPDDFPTLGAGGIAATDDAQLKAALTALVREKAARDPAGVLDRAA
ncbi:MAG: S41 family peptidase [Chloroflexi bacterium]|nr:S41 family peptidase [Chloroflexota bacterium]